MKVRGLQQQLAASTFLLPSQRDVLSRLLFQLAFNDFTRLAIVGGAGSGKTTLALGLAELFSDCDEILINVAMLQAPLADELLTAQLAKQWFAEPNLSKAQLLHKLTAVAESRTLVLIADDPEHLTATQYDWILTLPVRVFMFTSRADSNMQLNLALPVITLADCEQLLAVEGLDPLALAERFAHSQQNLHKLLHNVPIRTASAAQTHKHTSASTKPPIWALAVGLALVLIVIIASFLPDTTEPVDAGENVARNTSQVIVPLPDNTENANDTSVSSTEPSVVLSVPQNERSEITVDNKTVNEVPAAVIPPVDSVAPVLEPEIDPRLSEVVDLLPAVISSDAAVIQAEPVRDPISPATENKAVTASNEEGKVVRASAPKAALYDHQTLLQLPARQLLVQIAVLSSENALRRFTRNYPKLPVMVYQRQWQGRQQWVIVSGPFINNAAAKQHIQQLPSALSASGPFIKTVGAVQQEINAWQQLTLSEPSQGN
ncbi:SPOR domain-containing protein [Alishewanella tabrizica]|uniref:SPOR domain-containing protein n=1 Tax=Alishewanella tabrizica TaxID=671278 RepID=A0ABQ2WHQ9_9ALTE|nr:SPOR domain-containing protein [Alishewanella tabrizica]GGW52189.1 hypothetical protein GCM10008111_05230 [Alishewanella tabrizica]